MRTNTFRKNIPSFLCFMAKNDVKGFDWLKRWNIFSKGVRAHSSSYNQLFRNWNSLIWSEVIAIFRFSSNNTKHMIYVTYNMLQMLNMICAIPMIARHGAPPWTMNEFYVGSNFEWIFINRVSIISVYLCLKCFLSVL